MNFTKRNKKVGISLVLGISVAMGAMSLYSFADGIDKTVGRHRLDGDEAQYIYFGKIPNSDKYLKKVQGKEIMWKVNNNTIDEEKRDDMITMSIRREKIKSKGNEIDINDCFNAKEEGVLLDPKGGIREVKEIREIIKKVDEVKEGILEKIFNMIKRGKKEEEKGTKKQTRKVEYIDIHIPVANIIYKSSGSSRYCEVGSFKVLRKLEVSKNKLTILDNERKEFNVDEDEIIAKAGDVIKINYHNAILGEDQGREYISAIIKDTKGDAVYYGKFSNVFYVEGNVNIKLPGDIDAGEYELMILEEQENGAKKTNYAGYDTVKLIINK